MSLDYIINTAVNHDYQHKSGRLKHPASKNFNIVISEEAGQILFHDFSNKITIDDFANDIGLELKDFFPANDQQFNKQEYREVKNKRQLENELIHAWHFMVVFTADFEANKTQSPDDKSTARQYMRLILDNNFTETVYNQLSRERAMDVMADSWDKQTISQKYGQEISQWIN